MPVYVLKCYEPSRDLRHPDVTRRDQEPNPLDRVTVSIHPSVADAQAAGQLSYDKAYDNPPPTEGVDPDDDERVILDWGGDDGLGAIEDTAEAEYEIRVFPDLQLVRSTTKAQVTFTFELETEEGATPIRDRYEFAAALAGAAIYERLVDEGFLPDDLCLGDYAFKCEVVEPAVVRS